MRSNNLFWAILLILVGGILLMSNLGLLAGVSIWKIIWPLALMAFGGWVLWGALAGPRAVDLEPGAIPLEGASEAHVKLNHGAGRLVLGGGAAADQLASGVFGGGLHYRAHREGDRLYVKMRAREDGWSFFPPAWSWSGGLDWTVQLTDRIPLGLELETGANSAELDLTDLRVTDLKLETGASSTRVTLPANAGATRVRIEAGAASVSLRIPGGVAARVRVKGGLVSTSVDQIRFPLSGAVYQSPDYDTAANKADIRIESGVGSVSVQ